MATRQGLTARQLLGVLREMNEVRLDALRRIEALEVLRAPVRDVVERLDTQLQGDTFPMSEARIAVSAMILDFERELAIGYIAVACDVCAPDVRRWGEPPPSAANVKRL